MRRRSVLLVFLLLASTVACRPSRVPLAFHDARTFPAGEAKLVEIDARSLDVDVSVEEGENIAVKVDLEARASSRAAAARWVERSKPEFTDSAARLEVRVPSARRNVLMIGYFHTRGTIHVALPPRCRLAVHTSSGDVVLVGDTPLAETVRVETASGDVRVDGGARRLAVETASGDVRIAGGELDDLQTQTASGDVEARVPVHRAQADSASGDLRFDRLSGALSVHTASGDVYATWREVGDGSSVNVSSASGDVTLRLPRRAALAGKVSTSSGRIRSDFSGSFGRRERSFTLGGRTGDVEAAPGGDQGSPAPERPGGAVTLDVETSSGDVVLRAS